MTMIKRTLMVFLVLCLVFSLTACGTGDSTVPGLDDNNNISSERDSLILVSGFVVTEVWNGGFKAIRDYLREDDTPDGEEINIEQTIAQLERNMEKLDDHDAYIKGLDDKYSEVKNIWEKLYAESQIIYSAISDGTSSLDTDEFQLYLDEFSVATASAY